MNELKKAGEPVFVELNAFAKMHPKNRTKGAKVPEAARHFKLGPRGHEKVQFREGLDQCGFP